MPAMLMTSHFATSFCRIGSYQKSHSSSFRADFPKSEDCGLMATDERAVRTGLESASLGRF
jgi:hypothetical protein